MTFMESYKKNETIEILLIEDNADFIHFIKKILGDIRFKIKVIQSGLDGYNYLKNPEITPEIILLDSQLPGINGIELLEKINSENNDYSFIFLTVDNSIETVVKAMKNGAMDFIVKSGDLKNELLEKIEKVYNIHKNKIEKNRIEKELKIAQKEIEQNEKKFRALADTSPLAIYMSTGEEQKADYINHNFINLFGYNINEVPTIEHWWKLAYPDEVHRGAFIEEWTKRVEYAIKTQSEITPLESLVTSKDGTENYISWGFIALGKQNCVFGLDLTQRKKDEERIKFLLKEKEIILQEVHHRIKNNMTTIKSLLALQADNLDDVQAIAALKDAESRVQSMIVLYNKIFISANFLEISIKEYFLTFIDDIVNLFPNKNFIKLEKYLDDFKINSKQLFPLGIIINELLTNIMKYAFIDRSEGLIVVSIKKKDACAIISIEDNGNGLPEFVSFEESTGFGLMLVGLLVNQLDGTIKIERINGTKIILEFNLQKIY